MATPRVFTRSSAVTLKESEIVRRDFDWDRRLIVLEGEWANTTAAIAQYKNRPVQTTPSQWWPENISAKPVTGGLIRVTLECAGLIDGEEKWYELTEDNAEIRSYQLQNVTIYSPAYGWTPSAVYERATIDMGVPKLGWIGFTRTKPNQGLNGHPVPRPIRGVFPQITPPPWRVSATSVTANFPGGWRQMACPYKVLGGHNATGFPLMSPALYRGEWLYNYTDKITL